MQDSHGRLGDLANALCDAVSNAGLWQYEEDVFWVHVHNRITNRVLEQELTELGWQFDYGFGPH